MRQVHKEYARPFLLERTKLTRILDTIHQRLALHAHTTSRDRFEVFMSGDRREEMVNVDAVLQLDNSRKHKIRRLLIVSSAAADGSVQPEHEVQVDFCVSKTKVQGEAISSGKVVAVSVRSDDNGWASSTLSEVEEQVERTWLRQTPYILVLAGMVLGIVFFFGSQFLEPVSRLDTWDWLQPADVARVEQMLSAGRTLSEEEAREVTTMQLRNVILDQKQQVATRSVPRPSLLLVAPLLTLLAVSVALMLHYPSAVFLWGDEEERTSNRVQRRRILWGIVVTLLVGGILGKLLYEGAVLWIAK